ncbi:MAG: Asp-tRNA(Asn)/Glu-tRNA(Gln) amidotransferase subunit GatA [candidate division Zixibacteria bacterium]|nr:Asp-tRNA(Asn)/Glu-tRNA(Gln) amidotransferase subunit GatA [candidate division Zixibacteria bacterium]
MDITNLTATEIAAKARGGELTPGEVVNAFRRRVDAYDAAVGAFLCLNERENDHKKEGPLAGVPVAVKDNICTDWLPTTAASRVIENYRPPYNATVVKRLLAAGAYVVGKTNLDEFAMGSSTEYSAFFPARNPHDLTRSPGGSSGGSAAAVCAGFAPVALGSDTGGSIRQPAAMCGVVGLKPTYGRVSRYGLIAFAPSFDQIGPLARTVKDAALILKVIAGHDRYEATSSRREVPDYVAGLERDHGPFKVGLIDEFFGDDVAPGVRAATEEALEGLRKMGHAVERTTIPSAAWALPTYFVTACGETYSNLARYQGVLFGPRKANYDGPADMVAKTRARGFGGEVRRRLAAGAYVLSVGYRDRYYAKAQTIRQHMRAQFAAAFGEFDFLVSPVSPFTAFELNTRNLDPQLMYLADIFTSLANLVGIPALSMPCGFDEKGLPVALQVMAAPWDEERLLAVAHRLELELALPRDVVTPKPP